MEILFREEEFPYDKLLEVGLTREMVEDLPPFVKDDLLCGELSPVLFLCYYDEERDRLIGFKTKICFRRMDNGSVHVVYFPVLNRINLSSYSDKDRESLLSGKPIIISRVGNDGSQVQNVAQIDWQTNHVMESPWHVISKNLQVIGECLGLNGEELEILKKGTPLTIFKHDSPITIGIDLSTPSGTRVLEGEKDFGRAPLSERWGERFFGKHGSWLINKDGSLSYTPYKQSKTIPSFSRIRSFLKNKFLIIKTF